MDTTIENRINEELINSGKTPIDFSLLPTNVCDAIAESFSLGFSEGWGVGYDVGWDTANESE